MTRRGLEVRAPVIPLFLLAGAGTVLLGPILPDLRAIWQVSNSQIGSLFLAQFVASSAGSVLAGFRIERSLIGGYALIAAGAALLATGTWAAARPAMALLGLGLGLVITGSNLRVALDGEGGDERRGARLATLNLFWGLGATGCPLFLAALLPLFPLRAILWGLSVVAALGSLRLAATLHRASPGDPASTVAPAPRPDASRLFLATAATMFFLYVGAENAVGGWLVALAEEVGSQPALVSLLIGSGFWGAVLAGRAASPWVLRRFGEPRVYRGALVLAVAGTSVLATTDLGWVVAAAAVVAGLGMAPIFPLTVSILVSATSGVQARRNGWILACGGLGGAALPWLTGGLADLSGRLGRGFLVPLAGLVALAMVHALVTRLHPDGRLGPPRRARDGAAAPAALVSLILLGGLASPATGQTGDPAAPMLRALAEAEAALRQDELEIAESRYRTALGEGWLLLGALAEDEEDLEGAAEAFRRAADTTTDDRRALLALARVEMRRDRSDRATPMLRRLAGRDPADVEVRFALAQALSSQGSMDEAIQELVEVRALAPENLETLYALATAYLSLDRPESAHDLLEQLAVERPLPETWVLIGRTYRDHGLFDRARQALEAAIELDPEARRARYYLGTIALLDQGLAGIEEAVAWFQAEADSTPEDAVNNLYLGIALVESRRFEEAVQPLLAARSDPATDLRASHYLGQALLGLDRPAEAAEALSHAVAIFEGAAGGTSSGTELAASELGSLHYQLAQALRRSGREEEARVHFEEARRRSGELAATSRESLASYLAGEVSATASEGLATTDTLGLGGIEPKARTALEGRVATTMARCYLDLGVLQARDGRSARAARLFEAGAELDPDLPQIWFSLGVALFDSGRIERAIEPLTRALEERPADTGVRRMLALAHLERGDPGRAADLLSDDPGRRTDPSLGYAYALALVRSGRAAEAEPLFGALIAGNPDWPQLHVVIGQAQAQQGNYEAAFEALHRAIELDPTVAEAHSTLGDLYLRQGRLGEAEEALRDELEGHPEAATARYKLALVLELAQRPEEALDELRRHLEARPHSADGRYLLGKILLAQGAPDEALEQLDLAAELAPRDPNIRYQRGKALQRLGRADEAAAEFEAFRELKRGSDGEDTP